MEEIKSANITINLNEGSIVISGSEAFVEKNMESVFAFVERTNPVVICNPKKEEKKEDIAKNEMRQEDKYGDKEETDKYISAGVYHIDPEDNSISILKKIPGNNKAEKMKNIALIVLYIRKEKIIGKEIIPICEKHSCFDASNFAAIFKNEKTNMIHKGSGQKWTIELTQPGEEAAIALLEEMANDKK